MLYWLTKSLAYVIFRLYFGFRVIGREKVPMTGPIIIASNHSSMLDPLIVGAALRRKVHYMAKEELFRNPVFGWFLKRIGVFPVARGKGDRGAIKQALEFLKEGQAMGIFPEGTRSTDGTLGKAQPGMAMIAGLSGATIITAACVNSFAAFPKGRKFPKRVRIEFRVGEAYTAEELGLGSHDESGEGSGTDGDGRKKGAEERKQARARMERAGETIMESIRRLLEA